VVSICATSFTRRKLNITRTLFESVNNKRNFLNISYRFLFPMEAHTLFLRGMRKKYVYVCICNLFWSLKCDVLYWRNTLPYHVKNGGPLLCSQQHVTRPHSGWYEFSPNLRSALILFSHSLLCYANNYFHSKSKVIRKCWTRLWYFPVRYRLYVGHSQALFIWLP
jgi:hypothetical protein